MSWVYTYQTGPLISMGNLFYYGSVDQVVQALNHDNIHSQNIHLWYDPAAVWTNPPRRPPASWASRAVPLCSPAPTRRACSRSTSTACGPTAFATGMPSSCGDSDSRKRRLQRLVRFPEPDQPHAVRWTEHDRDQFGFRSAHEPEQRGAHPAVRHANPVLRSREQAEAPALVGQALPPAADFPPRLPMAFYR